MAGERREKKYRLTAEALAGLDALATRHHVTQTALVEAIGRLGRHTEPDWPEVVALARRIDRERLSRR